MGELFECWFHIKMFFFEFWFYIKMFFFLVLQSSLHHTQVNGGASAVVNFCQTSQSFNLVNFYQ